MATNQVRREAAKRKLVRQQERRVAQAKRRQQLIVVGSVVAVVVVVVAVVALTALADSAKPGASDAAAIPSSAATASAAATPAAASPAAAAEPGTCTFPAAGTAAKANQAPPAGKAPATGSKPVTLATTAGTVGLTLEPAEAPCAVESFLSLASQKYFDGTPCHRLTTAAALKVLQCGDPTGKGTGGPGYTIPDENPTGLAAAAGGSVTYPRGTVAMANTGQPNSGGSQFFLVYADSTLPPSYAVFGRIDAAGLAVLDKVAAAGSDNANGAGDGNPRTPITITTATVG